MHVHITKLSAVLADKPASLISSDDDDEKSSVAVVVEIPATPTGDNMPLPPYAVPGRPDVHSIIRRIASECEANQQVIVAACGPAGLSNDVRDAVGSCIDVDGPSLNLHLEAFGW
jgi:hypothetical protein